MCDSWANSIALFVLSVTPNLETIYRFVSTRWKKVAKPSIHSHEDGYFVIKFKTKKVCEDILQGGPYTMGWEDGDGEKMDYWLQPV